MLNYLKSEWYRVVRGKTIYVMAAILSAMIVVYNLILLVFGQSDADFPYATIRYSLNTLICFLSYLFSGAALVAALLFSDDRKNGTLKNSISYGIPRRSIFIGKCMISMASAMIIGIIVLTFYVGSAFLLLQGSGVESLNKLLEGIGAALPSILASIVLAAVVLSLCNNVIVSLVWWISLTYILPSVIFQIGQKVEFINVIAKWIPTNFFNHEVTATNSGIYDCLWNTPFGFMKCMVAGFGFTLVFAAVGLLGFRKKEV